MDRVGEIDIVNLHRRNVDRNGQWIRPARRFPASCPQDPLANLKNGAGLFGNGNEVDRRNFSSRRMFPAQQDLDADNLAGLNVRLRLIDQPHLAAGDGIAQIVLHEATVTNGFAH
jgi:hypothetical protein